MQKKSLILTDRYSTFVHGFIEYLQQPVTYVSLDHFSDTEIYVRCNDISLQGACVTVLFQCTSQQQDETINDRIFQLFILLDFIKNQGALSLNLIVPYLPYSRQEKSFCGDCTGPLNLIIKFLQTAGAHTVSTFDLHTTMPHNYFTIPLQEVSTLPLWEEIIKDHFLKSLSSSDQSSLCLVSPDKGRASYVQKIAEQLNLPYASFEKYRPDADKNTILRLHGDVRHKQVIIIDDILDTATTACNAADYALQQGAQSVIGCFTHALLSGNAVEKIANSSFKKIYLTDTLIHQPIQLPRICSLIHVGALNAKLYKDTFHEIVTTS